MPVDLSKLPVQRREAAIRIGGQFPSDYTKRQSASTLKGLTRFGKELAASGYGEEDAAELKDLREQLLEASGRRASSRVDKGAGSQEVDRAIRAAKRVRLQAHAILDRAALLLEGGDPAAAARVMAALSATRSAGADVEKLRVQVSVLQAALADKAVAAVTGKRGGPEALAALKQADTALAAAESARPGRHATPESVELDLLDGLVAENVRDARRVARAAARALGRPEIAAAFELRELYPRRRGGGEEEPGGPGPEGPKDGGGGA